MLTVARSWIGEVHQSHTCTSIQVSNYLSVDHRNMLILNTLGACALVETFKEAAMLYTWTNGYLGKKNLKKYLPPDELVKQVTMMQMQSVLGNMANAATGQGSHPDPTKHGEPPDTKGHPTPQTGMPHQQNIQEPPQ